jgi:hypothetical protein
MKKMKLHTEMKPFIKRVLLTAALAGTLDILSAYTNVFIKTHHISKKMFNYIAGGALGLKDALSGGGGVVLLGVFFHYFIAFSFTLFFFLTYRKFRLSSVNPYVMALLYGLFVWAVMNLVVLPLSLLPSSPFSFQKSIVDMLVLSVMIGLPVSLSANRYFAKISVYSPPVR